MTIELTEYRCPTCGHTMGEEEFREAHNKLEKIKQEIHEELTGKHQKEMQLKDAEYQKEMQLKDAEHESHIQGLVDQKVQNRIKSIEEKHQQEIKNKDEELETAKLQRALLIEEAVESNNEMHKQKETQAELHLNRIKGENTRLAGQVDKLQQTIDNLPPEFRGTAGELRLLEKLREHFPHDDLVPKKVGVEMPDVVQTIVTESGERISIPILWDNKAGKAVTPTDIDKAKKYKEKYDTDYCLIVTERGITKKDSKSYRISAMGRRDNVILVHPTIVPIVGELMRSFIIEKVHAAKNSNGRDSKEKKLYDYITGSIRFRQIREKIENKIKLDELHRKEMVYIIKAWKDREKLIQHWYDLDRDDQKSIDAITSTVQTEQLPGLVEECDIEEVSIAARERKN